MFRSSKVLSIVQDHKWAWWEETVLTLTSHFGLLPPIPTTHCHNDSRELKDGPKELWHPSLVGDQINMFVKKHNIETVSIYGRPRGAA